MPVYIICHPVAPGVDQLHHHVSGDVHDSEQLHAHDRSVFQEEEGGGGDICFDQHWSRTSDHVNVSLLIHYTSITLAHFEKDRMIY